MKRLIIITALLLSACGSSEVQKPDSPQALAQVRVPMKCRLTAPFNVYGIAFKLKTPETSFPDFPLQRGFSGARFTEGEWRCLVMVGSGDSPLNGELILRSEDSGAITIVEAVDKDGNALDVTAIKVEGK